MRVLTITAHCGAHEPALRLIAVHPSPTNTKPGAKCQLKKLSNADISIKFLWKNILKQLLKYKNNF